MASIHLQPKYMPFVNHSWDRIGSILGKECGRFLLLLWGGRAPPKIKTLSLVHDRLDAECLGNSCIGSQVA